MLLFSDDPQPLRASTKPFGAEAFMAATASDARPLQYFIHDDFDALRMEISGSLAGREAQKAYDALRTASFMARRQTLVIDISYVSDLDERGLAILRAWRGEGAQIVAAK